MTPALLAKDILQKIIVENMPFSLALKQAFKKNEVSKEERQTISAVVGCSLRHYIVMERLFKDAYPELESEGLVALLIAFSNALFIKKLDQDECNALAQSFLKEISKLKTSLNHISKRRNSFQKILKSVLLSSFLSATTHLRKSSRCGINSLVN